MLIKNKRLLKNNCLQPSDVQPAERMRLLDNYRPLIPYITIPRIVPLRWGTWGGGGVFSGGDNYGFPPLLSYYAIGHHQIKSAPAPVKCLRISDVT